MFGYIRKIATSLLFVLFFTFAFADEKVKLPLDGASDLCRHCTVTKGEKVEERLTDAFLLLRREKETLPGETVRTEPFSELPLPPVVGEVITNLTDVRELSPGVETVQYIVPEPKEVPEVKFYDTLSEDIEFPEDVTEEVEDDEEEEDEEELILTKLKLGGRMSILTRRSGNDIKFEGIDGATLSCDLIDNTVVKKTKLRGQNLLTDSCNQSEGGKEVSVDILRLNGDVTSLVNNTSSSKILSSIEDIVSSNNVSNFTNQTTGLPRKALVSDYSHNCELCSESGKCFFHRRSCYNLNKTPSTCSTSRVKDCIKERVNNDDNDDNNNDDDSDNDKKSLQKTKTDFSKSSLVGVNTTVTVENGETSIYSGNEGSEPKSVSDSIVQSTVQSKSSDSDKSQFVSDDDDDEEASEEKKMQGELDKIESSDTKQESDLKILMESMTSLVKMIKESKEEQVRTREELRKEREILARIALDLDNTKNVTHLYIQMTRLDMEIALAKQSIEQLKRDEEKNKATVELLVRYENQTGMELETISKFIKKSEVPSKKLLALFDKVSSRKETIQRMQIDVSKRLETIKNRIDQLSEYIEDLEKQKVDIKTIISKINDIEETINQSEQ
ncbi:mucin like protein [Cryptosporidium xiaoi]|uniref:Mucin like protein n=1 Tax=Cryptosporidium xiaoi TaxID=659607 RepID=A0AAV9Y3I3_9CRYT